MLNKSNSVTHKIHKLSDYGEMSGNIYFMNSYNSTFLKILETVQYNEIKYLKFWITTYEINIRETFNRNIKPMEVIFFFRGNNLVSIIDCSNNKCIEDIRILDGAYMSSNENDCIDYYNGQVYGFIKYYKDKINEHIENIAIMEKLIDDSKNNFINTDLVMETLKND